jgi:hypothetical protein
VLRSVRFPYRWHAGTLAALAWLAGTTVDRLASARPRLGRALAGLPWLEGFLLSPIAPLLPSAPAAPPPAYAEVARGEVLLAVPGPLAMPPGEINRSRPRARYLLWGLTRTGAQSPWAPDFNGVAAGHEAPWLDAWRSWDPLTRRTPAAPDLAATRAAGVDVVAVHAGELGSARARELVTLLRAAGARPRAEAEGVTLLDLPPAAR